MKSIKHICTLMSVASAAITTSCTDSFLEQDPLSFYEPSTTYNTESGLQAAMAVCDRHLRYHFINGNANNCPIATDYLFSEIGIYGKTDANATDLMDNLADKITPTSGLGGNCDGNMIQLIWDESFNGIKYANTVLSYIDGVSSLSEETKNAYKGRAYFHRAYNYYNMVFQFGDLPLITRIIDSPKQDYKSTKKEAILEMLVHDLEFAVENVPTQANTQYYGMVNKEACMHLLVKCYLATGRYKDAETLATKLISGMGLDLMREPFGTFNPGGNPETWKITRNVIWDLHRAENKSGALNKEAIMVVNNFSDQAHIDFCAMRIFGPFWNGNINNPAGAKDGERYASSHASYRATGDWVRVLGRGIATQRLSSFAQKNLWIIDGEMDNQDLRHNSEVGNWVNMTDITYNVPATPEWFGKNFMMYHPENGKLLCTDSIRSWFDHPLYKLYYNDAVSDANSNSNEWQGARKGSNGNMYLFRLAETYLLRAEARFYQGNGKGAAEDVNEIRKRANAKKMYGADITIGDIANERARELYLEEFRNVELTRISMCLANSGKPDEWGNTYSKDNWDKQQGTEATGGSYWYQRCIKYSFYNSGITISSGRAAALNYRMDKRNLFWPIPNSAITANNGAKLAQNYGYDGYDASVEMFSDWQKAVEDEKGGK